MRYNFVPKKVEVIESTAGFAITNGIEFSEDCHEVRDFSPIQTVFDSPGNNPIPFIPKEVFTDMLIELCPLRVTSEDNSKGMLFHFVVIGILV